MFTGIVEGTGTVRTAERRGDILVVRVDVGKLFEGLPLGGSVAVNGCCLTAVSTDAFGFTVELTEETLRRTRFDDRLHPGVRINLERPMKADGRFDGHVVQGHVDGIGRVREMRSLGESAEIRIEAPEELERYLVEKGSICVDGISLTAYGLGDRAFSVALIPYTLEIANLRDARPGDFVNLEADVIAKYVERLLAARGL
ncbi:MAG: riboflavin synthase [Vicinamibacteria bacterium]